MYQRLSADEGEEESNSVKNQKILMDYYLKNNKDIKIYNCLKTNGQFINCDRIALTEDFEEHQLYELEHNIENYKHIDTPLTVEHELEILREVGFKEITSSTVDKDDYSLIKARRK